MINLSYHHYSKYVQNFDDDDVKDDDQSILNGDKINDEKKI